MCPHSMPIIWWFVTGASIHAPRQSNSTYRQSDSLIYEPRLLEHPPSPIRRYKIRPQGPPSQPHYTESCSVTALLYATDTFRSTSTATSTTPCISASVAIIACTAPLHQDIAHRRIRYTPLSLSSVSVFLVTVFDLIRLMIFDLIRLNYGLDLTRLTCFCQFDSTHV